MKPKRALRFFDWRVLVAVTTGILFLVGCQCNSRITVAPSQTLKKRAFSYSTPAYPLSLWSGLAKSIRNALHPSVAQIPLDLSTAIAIAPTYYLVSLT